MGGIHLFILKLLCYEVASSAYYFHEPSHIELTSPDGDLDFGFSINYQKTTNNLVVGSPKSDLNGKVFTCPLTDITKNTKENITCNRANIDIDKLAKEFREPPTGVLDQKCHLGASLAVTDNYIFTCAPLCSIHVIRPKISKLGAFGTCFVYDGQNASRYCGVLEKNDPKIDDSYGGVGWSTFADPINKIIIIAKSVLSNYIAYLDIDHPLEPVKEINTKDLSQSFTYRGTTFAAGIFFNDKKYHYAMSMKQQDPTGGIAFLSYDEVDKELKILMHPEYERPILITEDESISMYGTALHSADLNNDNFSELIVGAPAYSTKDIGYEHGAIYLYKGGGEVVERRESTLRITGTKDAARFGTSIASTDLDGDGLAELFVSAPYERGGVVYILLGYEIRQLLHATKETLLSNLIHTQTIQITNFKTFGYSLHAFQTEGANFLAVGSPSTSKVALFRSLTLVNVSLSLRVQGDKSVREQDTNFTVIVTVKLENAGISLPSNIQLLLSTAVTGDQVEIEGDTTKEIELSKIKPENTYNVVVLLGKIGPGDYKFTATIKDKEPFKQRDFDASSVKLTPQSNTLVIEVPRHCKGDDCVPRFLVDFQWSGRPDQYLLGSNESETMQLIIDNEGNSTYDSCAWIKVTGAQIQILECNPLHGIWYKCPLRIERDDTHKIDILLDMSRPTNKDKGLNVEVRLFNRCAPITSNATITKNKEITYIFDNKDIEIQGFSTERNFTDSEIHDDESNAIINIHETYKITNNATISWKEVVAVWKFRDLSFVKSFMIIDKKKCKRSRSKGFIQIKCIIDVNSMSTEFIRTSILLSKSKLIPHLKKRILVLNSSLEVYFESAETKLAKYTTTIYMQRDADLWDNPNIIILVAVIVGLFILGTLTIILYKIGFFKRKGKKKVRNLRDSIRKGTFRRPSTSADASNNKSEVQEARL